MTASTAMHCTSLKQRESQCGACTTDSSVKELLAAGTLDLSRRSLAALLATVLSLQARAEDEPPYFRAENSSVESDTTGVKKEEKVAVSSTTSTEPGTSRGSGQRLQKEEVGFLHPCLLPWLIIFCSRGPVLQTVIFEYPEALRLCYRKDCPNLEH